MYQTKSNTNQKVAMTMYHGDIRDLSITTLAYLRNERKPETILIIGWT